MGQAKPAPKVLFVHYLYSDQIQKAAADLAKHDGAECFFESSPKSALERCLTIQPDVVLIHGASPSDQSKFPVTKNRSLFGEYFFTSVFLKKFSELPNNPLPKLVVVTRIDEHGCPLAFNFWDNDEVVSNYIMPPQRHWDILLAVRQTLYRKIEYIEHSRNISPLGAAAILASGRSGTVMEILDDGRVVVECADDSGVTKDLFVLPPSEVRLVWSADGAG